jgi:hypothetical protein
VEVAMSEPSELSADARSLVEQGRAADAPSATDKQRIKSRLTAELGASAFVVTALSSTLPAAVSGGSVWAAPGTAARGLWRHGLVKLAGAATAVGALGALYFGAVSWTPTPAPANAYAPVVVPQPQSPTSVERAMPEAIAADEPQPATQEPPATPTTLNQAAATTPAVVEASPPARQDPTTRTVVKRSDHAALALAAAAKEPRASTLSAELTLLAAAQRALRDHQPQQALLVARQHAARFAGGSLGEERRGIEALAHCQLGERKHPSVAAFLQEAPSSPLAARVQKECAEP